ncbi:MAG TPA: PLD nuclease N-terminal domain-containing protein [Phycisphaerales bacterium]|nr:PLD nuclease N-terminal domain-containing protein [Phycisphaerales bacterium]
MAWLLPILIHALACLIAVADVTACPMTARARTAWLTAVLLLPVIGAAAYAVWGRRMRRCGETAEPGVQTGK